MLANVLLGVLGVLLSLVTLAALLLAVLFFAFAAACEPGDFYCVGGGRAWAGVGLFGLAMAAVAGALAFTFWQALHRRILGDPDAWWLWYEKGRTDTPTVTAEWLRDVNRRRAEKARSGTEAQREEDR